MTETKSSSFRAILALEGFLLGAYAVQSLLDFATTTNDWISSISIITGASLF